jgi:prepilin-type N-terminal cleavage/methylation domain-containing protein
LPKRARNAAAGAAGSAGFTLLELMAVLAIVGIIMGAIVGLRSDNPEGLNGAARISESVFRTARGVALLSPNPDENPETNPLYNIRARVLILRDSERQSVVLQEDKCRRMRVIVGGTRKPEETKPEQYVWYGTKGADTVLPKGIFMVAPDAEGMEGRVSKITNKDGTEVTMKLNFEPDKRAQTHGSGDTEWYFYEFNSDGTANMNMSVFMVADGRWDPEKKQPVFANRNSVAGFCITPSGSTVGYTDVAEMNKSLE